MQTRMHPRKSQPPRAQVIALRPRQLEARRDHAERRARPSPAAGGRRRKRWPFCERSGRRAKRCLRRCGGRHTRTQARKHASTSASTHVHTYTRTKRTHRQKHSHTYTRRHTRRHQQHKHRVNKRSPANGHYVLPGLSRFNSIVPCVSCPPLRLPCFFDSSARRRGRWWARHSSSESRL